MTLIEFYDRTVAHTSMGPLALKPDKIILVGEKFGMKEQGERLRALLASRGCPAEVEYRVITRSEVRTVLVALADILDGEPDCQIDLTGGEDLALFAAGQIFERYRKRGLQYHWFNVRTGQVKDCDLDGEKAVVPQPALSVEEQVALCGGRVIFDDEKPDASHRWPTDEGFGRDIEAMWAILRSVGKYGTVGSWNKQIKTFEAIEECGEIDGLTSRAGKSVLEACLARDGEKLKPIAGVIRRLRECRLAEVEEDDRSITVTYKNEQVKRCLTKAGQALEMIVYLYALQAVDEQRMRVYNDVMTGVYIDWDGDIHTEQDGFDTENEIDVMMMRGAIPVFISCKNGKIDMDELYKLDAVATKFGGKYARRVLVATSLGKSRFASYFRQRAKDMGVDLLEPMDLTDAEFRAEIGHAWSYITKREPQA